VPFGRPPLSKTYLRGEENMSGWLVVPPDWYGKNGPLAVRDSGHPAEQEATAHHAPSRGQHDVEPRPQTDVATGVRLQSLAVAAGDAPRAHVRKVGWQLRSAAASQTWSTGVSGTVSAMTAPGTVAAPHSPTPMWTYSWTRSGNRLGLAPGNRCSGRSC
jgi:hypothetical protein